MWYFLVSFAEKLLIFIGICRWIDGLTISQTNRPSYSDGRRYLARLKYLLGHLFAQKYLFPWFLTKAWPTEQQKDEPMDGWTDEPTDRPCYRNARTHQKMDRLIDGPVDQWTYRTFYGEARVHLMVIIVIDKNKEQTARYKIINSGQADVKFIALHGQWFPLPH